MNVEDSYEGAVRRLRRLGQAGLVPPIMHESDDTQDRLRDLEELATLACDDNERLTRELDGARDDNARLRQLVATLQATLAGAPADEPFAAPKPRGRGLALFFFAAILVGGGVAVYQLRPWESRQAVAAAMVAPALQPSAPVVAAPPPVVPKIEPTVPKIEPVMAPKVTVPVVVAPKTIVPTVRASEPAHVKSRSQHRHAAKHHAAKSKRHAESKHAIGDTDDPLGGVNL